MVSAREDKNGKERKRKPRRQGEKQRFIEVAVKVVVAALTANPRKAFLPCEDDLFIVHLLIVAALHEAEEPFFEAAIGVEAEEAAV